jgi:hypothetical protein
MTGGSIHPGSSNPFRNLVWETYVSKAMSIKIWEQQGHHFSSTHNIMSSAAYRLNDHSLKLPNSQDFGPC